MIRPPVVAKGGTLPLLIHLRVEICGGSRDKKGGCVIVCDRVQPCTFGYLQGGRGMAKGLFCTTKGLIENTPSILFRVVYRGLQTMSNCLLLTTNRGKPYPNRA